ncbi:MAG: hypothetical protein WD513_05875 [Balneolaceae bacterium]
MNIGQSFSVRNRQPKVKRLVCVVLISLFGFIPSLFGQVVEDTTRVDREGPPPDERVRYNTFIVNPYRSSILQSELNRFQVNDYDGRYTFFRRLRSQNTEDFLFAEEPGYHRYGAEWERELNENLMALLSETFKEESDLMRMLARIAPFLGFSFYEPYLVPVVPRTEDPDLVPIDEP